MLRKLKIAAATVACALSIAPAAGAMDFHNKIPAYDFRGQTIIDARDNCVLTKWDGASGECNATASNLWRTVFFAFDSAQLTAEAKAKLDRLYTRVSGDSTIVRANIVGYADEIGSDSYNQKLSERRATAVHNYLKGMGYDRSNVTEVRALGERSSADKCKGLARKDKIACLWEDRRVEIELEYLNKHRRVIR